MSNARFATVTTTEDHGYDVGQIIRLIVPPEYGMDIYYKQVKILEVPADDMFTCDYDTTQLAPFVEPGTIYQQAQTTPISGTEFNDVTITG